MIGDVADMVARMLHVLPRGWFADSPPVLTAVLSGLGACWSAVYTLIQAVVAESRILTATGPFLDLVSADFFGLRLPRRAGEADEAFRTRIEQELFRARGTRAAVVTAVTELTGYAPAIFEPARPADTGGYAVGGVGYGAGGGYGSLLLPFQFFVQARRPPPGGITQLAGYGTGGVPVYASLSMVPAQVGDSDIYAAVAGVLPAASTAWVAISG